MTVLIYALAQSQGTTRMGLMLLAGIAVNALAGAGLGWLSFLASDEQLRSLQFWLLGSLGGARWSAVALVGAVVAVAAVAGLRLARPLNAIALGEAQAALLGGALVLVADAVAGTVVQPAELPLGVLTALIGVPVFLLMLRHFRSSV